MRPRAGLHPDKAGITMREELQNLAAAELALQHDRALLVEAVELKDVLGQIDADGDRLLHGRLPR